MIARNRATIAATLIVAAIIAGLALSSSTAGAHAFGERYELPTPVWLFVLGGALTVTVTFVVVAAFARASAERYAYAEVELRLGALARRITRSALATLGIVALLLALLAGYLGAANPHRNIAPTLVWIVGWVGLSYVAMLIGDLWPQLNPWRTLFLRFASPSGNEVRAARAPSAWWGVALLLLFGWIELIFPLKADPRALAALVTLYSIVTWVGMARFGCAAWLARVDPFARSFALLGRFAPLGRNTRGALVLRPYAADLMRARAEPGDAAAIAFTIALLAIVLFDGLLGTSRWTAIEDAIHALNPKLGDAGWLAVHSVGLVVTWLVFLALYWLAIALANRLGNSESSMLTVATHLLPSLVPIAVGYHFAHSFTYLLVQVQGVIALASDPLGWGWNLFGTRERAIDPAIIGARMTWYVAFSAIVLGHAISVYVAHVLAERDFGSRRRTLLALVPITVLMILYTVISLQILAEPLVRYSGPQETII